MECISLYITRTIQDFLTKSFIGKAKNILHTILHLRFLLKYILSDSSTIIMQQFIDYYFDNAARKAYFIVSGGREFYISINFPGYVPNYKAMDIDKNNYFYFVRLLTKKYQYGKIENGDTLMDDGENNIIRVVFYNRLIQPLYTNLLKYFIDGKILWININSDNIHNFLAN